MAISNTVSLLYTAYTASHKYTCQTPLAHQQDGLQNVLPSVSTDSTFILFINLIMLTTGKVHIKVVGNIWTPSTAMFTFLAVSTTCVKWLRGELFESRWSPEICRYQWNVSPITIVYFTYYNIITSYYRYPILLLCWMFYQDSRWIFTAKLVYPSETPPSLVVKLDQARPPRPVLYYGIFPLKTWQ